MMEIRFELTENSGQNPTYLSLGYFIFTNENGALFEKIASKPCMLFPSIGDLMDALSDLELGDKSTVSFDLTGTSFQFQLALNNEILTISENDGAIMTVEIGVFAKKLKLELNRLLKEYSIDSIKSLGDLSDDLYTAQLHFSGVFAYALK